MNFFNKPTEKELMRQSERELLKFKKNLASDHRQLEHREKELELQIKALAKAGQKEACVVLAKQLVQLRKQKTKNINLSGTVSSTSNKNRQMNTMNTMSKALGTTTKTIKTVNQKLPLSKFGKNLHEFSETLSRLDLQSNVIVETLDSMLDADENDEDMVINQVLDEIGIEINAKLLTAARVKDTLPSSTVSKSKSRNEDIDLEQIAKQFT